MAHLFSIKEGRIGQLQLPVEGKDLAGSDEAGGVGNSVWRQEVDGAGLIVIAK